MSSDYWLNRRRDEELSLLWSLSFFQLSLTDCKWTFRSRHISLGKSAWYLFRWSVIISRICAQLSLCNHVRPRGNKETFQLLNQNSCWDVYGTKLPQGCSSWRLSQDMGTFTACHQPGSGHWVPATTVAAWFPFKQLHLCILTHQLCELQGDRAVCRTSCLLHCFRPAASFLEQSRFPDIHNLEYVKIAAFCCCCC